jgi:RNA polymerase sigma-70 factor, ECF subfamily
VNDTLSVRALHDAYAGPLFVYALRRLGDPEAAEEVVQDTLVRAWQHADRYDPQRGSVSTWLYAIARNLVVDDARRRSTRPDSVPAEAIDEPADGAPDFDRLVEAWQVAEAVAQLEDHHRDAILECYYRGHTVVEAAKRLGVPTGTVKSRLFYGMRILRLKLEEMGVVS